MTKQTRATLCCIALGLALLFGAVACSNGNKVDERQIEHEYAEIYERYGVNTRDIQGFEVERTQKLLEDNGLTDYSINSEGLRDYHCSAEDFKAIESLDETYLRAFYSFASDESVDAMAQGLGFRDLNDYLDSKGLLYQNGKINGPLWAAYDSVEMAKIMSQE